MRFFIQSKLLAACIIMCCLWQSNLLIAQDEIDTTFSNRMNFVFGVLEKNRVPNGMLQDYAMEFTNLNKFNNDTEKIYRINNVLEFKNIFELQY